MVSPEQNPNDWYAQFVTVKNTFSARIGQICNAALDRSVIAHNEKPDPKLRKQFKEETEVLAILSGLEIDAAKTGIRPDLSDYLGRKIQRTPFLKYKTLVEEAEEQREWYEDTHREKLNKFFADTNWEKVDSPVERLPLLAQQLQKGTKKPKTRKAKDEELFLFAQEKDWRKKLNPHTLHRVGVLVEDYKSCLKRIRSGLAEQPILFRPQTHISEAGQLSVVKALSRQVSHHGKVCDGFGQVHKAAALRNTGKSLRQGAFDAEPHGSIPAELPRVQFRISAA